jgi:hypothetical protein
MTHLVRRFAVASLLSALAACQSVGNGQAFQQTEGGRTPSLKVGVSTRDDVRREFGDAKVYAFDNGFESWTYQSTSGVPRWIRFVPYLGLLPLDSLSHTKELALLFDAQGILRHAEWHVSDDQDAAGAHG